jgi:hypothetical protein
MEPSKNLPENLDFGQPNIIDSLKDMEKQKKNYFFEANQYSFTGELNLAIMNFENAKKISTEMDELFSKLLNAVNKNDNADSTASNEIRKLVESNKNDMLIIECYLSLNLGESNISKRNPQESIENFKDAKNGFELLSTKNNIIQLKILSELANSMETASEGYEEIYRLNYIKAKMLFKRAQVAMDNIIKKYSNENEEIKDKEILSLIEYIFIWSKTMESYYHLSNYRDLFIKGDFSSAAEEAQKLIELDINNIENSKNKFSENLLKINEGNYHFHLAEKYLIDGELMRENEEWDEALDFYKKSRSEWEDSSNCYIESGTPQAIALQETASNNSYNVSGIYIRNCIKERSLKEEINNLTKEICDLRTGLLETLKRGGITVNNTQEMISTVEQNIQVVQKLEKGIKENIENAVKEFEKLPVDDAKKIEVKEKANEVLKSNEQGEKLIEKTKNFTKDLREIVENVGEIAKPVSPYLNFLAKVVPLFI